MSGSLKELSIFFITRLIDITFHFHFVFKGKSIYSSPLLFVDKRNTPCINAFQDSTDPFCSDTLYQHRSLSAGDKPLFPAQQVQDSLHFGHASDLLSTEELTEQETMLCSHNTSVLLVFPNDSLVLVSMSKTAN